MIFVIILMGCPQGAISTTSCSFCSHVERLQTLGVTSQCWCPTFGPLEPSTLDVMLARGRATSQVDCGVGHLRRPTLKSYPRLPLLSGPCCRPLCPQDNIDHDEAIARAPDAPALAWSGAPSSTWVLFFAVLCIAFGLKLQKVRRRRTSQGATTQLRAQAQAVTSGMLCLLAGGRTLATVRVRGKPFWQHCQCTMVSFEAHAQANRCIASADVRSL